MAGPATPAALYKMITIPEAQDTVLSETRELPSVTVPLAEAVGTVLAEDVLARDPLPPFAASIKDGYAVRAADGTGDFDVAFEVYAGAQPEPLPAGTVAYIGTGGPLPEGSDAVVQIENTEQLPPGANGRKRVRINIAAAGPGDDVRAEGSDIRAGQVVLAAGDRLGPAEIGILATVGAANVQVHKRARVGVLSTGDELVEVATAQLGPAQIRDANRAMLLAAAAEAGAEPVDLGIARDSAGQVEEAFQRAVAAGVDILLTTGGVSMGDKDFIKPLLEHNAIVHFGKVKMKPGKPLTFATLDLPASTSGGDAAAGAPATRRMMVFGLPGNPVSSIVTFNLVVVPALRKMAGWKEPRLRRVYARLTQPIKLDPVRPEYHRATLHWGRPSESPAPPLSSQLAPLAGELKAVSTGGQISSRLLSMRSANALLELPQASGTLPAGTMVSALLIGDLGEMPMHEATEVTPMP